MPKSFDILSDVSGGKGITPSKTNQWPKPYHDNFGYAGGIGPHNVIDVLNQLSGLIEAGQVNTWIDMESSLKCKSTGRFQVENAVAVLEKLRSCELVKL